VNKHVVVREVAILEIALRRFLRSVSACSDALQRELQCDIERCNEEKRETAPEGPFPFEGPDDEPG